MDLYSQQKQALSFSANPYEHPQHQRQVQVQAARRFSPVPRLAPKPPPTSTNGISQTLTQEQINRMEMEDNRRRALTIRMKKQNDASH